MIRTLSAEEEVLVLAARIDMDAVSAARMDSLLRRRLDWAAIERRSAPCGVQPLLFHHVSSGQRAALVPAGTMSLLREAHRRTSIRSLRHLGHAARILDTLSQAGMPAVLLKGALLAGSLYPDAALRPMADIDLLCREHDAERVRGLLQALGYRQEPLAAKSAAHERLRAERSNHLPAFSGAHGIAVEAHLQLFAGLEDAGENLASVWESARPGAWNGRPVLCLAPEDQLAHLVVHCHGHLSEFSALRLYWLCDLHEFFRALPADFDAERFLARIDALGMRAGAAAVVDLLRRHWRTPVPDAIASGLGDAATPLCLASLLARGAGGLKLALQASTRRLGRVADAGGGRAVVSYLCRAVWPSREFIAQRYRLKNPLLAYPYAVRFVAAYSFQWLCLVLADVHRRTRGFRKAPPA